VAIGDVVAGEVMPYNRPTSPQSILSAYCGQSVLMEGLCVPSVTRAVVAILYLSFGCTDPLQVLHVVCRCEDDQLSVLSSL
jgi:hypothetical protein